MRNIFGRRKVPFCMSKALQFAICIFFLSQNILKIKTSLVSQYLSRQLLNSFCSWLMLMRASVQRTLRSTFGRQPVESIVKIKSIHAHPAISSAQIFLPSTRDNEIFVSSTKPRWTEGENRQKVPIAYISRSSVEKGEARSFRARTCRVAAP